MTEPDANISSTIGVQLSVLPQYLPAIDTSDAGDNGLVEMAPGDETNVSIMVSNNGNVNDTILLSVGQTPDLIAFWSNWTSGGNNNSNSTGNSTGNNTGGNNTPAGTTQAITPEETIPAGTTQATTPEETIPAETALAVTTLAITPEETIPAETALEGTTQETPQTGC